MILTRRSPESARWGGYLFESVYDTSEEISIAC